MCIRDRYINGYEDKGNHIAGYDELIALLTKLFPLGVDIVGEDKEKEFIRLFGRILRLRNILLCFDDFIGNDTIAVRDFQDYQSRYIDLYQSYAKKDDAEKERKMCIRDRHYPLHLLRNGHFRLQIYN